MTDRQTDRHTHTQTDRERQRERKRERQSGRETEERKRQRREKQRERERERDCERGKNERHTRGFAISSHDASHVTWIEPNVLSVLALRTRRCFGGASSSETNK